MLLALNGYFSAIHFKMGFENRLRECHADFSLIAPHLTLNAVTVIVIKVGGSYFPMPPFIFMVVNFRDGTKLYPFIVSCDF